MTTPLIELPRSFLEMPRWWHEGEAWLAALPELVRDRCETWNLEIDGVVRHGSNAIAIPVRRGGERLVLRMTLPDAQTADEVRALRFWAGRGTVRLIEADPAQGASLLERLDGERSLARLPLAEAMPILGRLMWRLAVPDPPPDVRSTAAIARERAGSLGADWERLGQPFSRRMLDTAVDAAGGLETAGANLAVNGDLHFEQVLGGEREPWLAVDPVLLRGDIAYDLARILWTRLDEMASDDEVRRWFAMLVDAAGLDRERAAAWVMFRTVDYWLWGLGYGLTEDPVRCARLVGMFAGV